MLEKLIKLSWVDYSQAMNLIMGFTIGQWTGRISYAQIFETMSICRHWINDFAEKGEDYQALKEMFDGLQERLDEFFIDNEELLMCAGLVICDNYSKEDETRKNLGKLVEYFKTIEGSSPEWDELLN